MSRVPIINAGDGSHSHPTQTLTDLLTISREKGRLDHLTIGVCGDLKFGRTVHSLIAAMARYTGLKLVLISPEELRVPGYVRYNTLEPNNIPFEETEDLESVIGKLDILYMTRIQKERFEDEATYERLKESYILTADKMKLARPDMAVLHPLPRVNEISVAVDDDPRACYFKQVLNGKYMRMALMLKLLKAAEEHPGPEHRFEGLDLVGGPVCKKGRCITRFEQELKPLYRLTDRKHNIYRCAYCEAKRPE